MSKSEDVEKAQELKELAQNYYDQIQRLQLKDAAHWDLIADLDRKLEIKKLWNRVWGIVSALLALLLAIKCA